MRPATHKSTTPPPPVGSTILQRTWNARVGADPGGWFDEPPAPEPSLLKPGSEGQYGRHDHSPVYNRPQLTGHRQPVPFHAQLFARDPSVLIFEPTHKAAGSPPNSNKLSKPAIMAQYDALLKAQGVGTQVQALYTVKG